MVELEDTQDTFWPRPRPRIFDLKFTEAEAEAEEQNLAEEFRNFS